MIVKTIPPDPAPPGIIFRKTNYRWRKTLTLSFSHDLEMYVDIVECDGGGGMPRAGRTSDCRTFGSVPGISVCSRGGNNSKSPSLCWSTATLLAGRIINRTLYLARQSR
ncbi:hypothetical protein J6590_073868 [Homalodisca vitripennis]|nr:hypothetical protein J6590_073868 [Homalodisca vitripennis]